MMAAVDLAHFSRIIWRVAGEAAARGDVHPPAALTSSPWRCGQLT